MQELIRADLSVLNIAQTKFKKLNQESIWIFLFFSLLAIAIISPISSVTAIPNLGDYIYHLAAIIQAKTALMQGQFPLRIMPFEHNGLGYPLYQFYSPTSYTFAGLIYWLFTPTNPLLAFNLALWCGLMLGGIFMFRLAFWFIQSTPAAILAGVVYLCAPYYVIIINHLGSLQEIIALGVLPGVLFYTLQRYYDPQNPRILLKLSIGWYLLFTIHIPTAIYASLLFAILFFVMSFQNVKRWRNLISVGIAYALGCLLAMWFLAPAGLFAKYFLISNTYVNPDHLSQFRPSLSNLLFPAAALTGGYKSNALMTIHPSIGLPILTAVAICIYAYFNKSSSGCRRADYWMPGLLIIFFIAFLLAWSPVNFWRWLPQPLLAAQHCWRVLGQVIWIGSLLFSWAVYWLFKGKLDARHIILGTFFIIICVNPWFPVAENSQIDLHDFIKRPYLIYNGDSMLLNYNKYPDLVAQIDSVPVDANNLLHTHSAYLIPAPLLKLAHTPVISINGNMPAYAALTAIVNGTPVTTRKFKPGQFTWDIPLNIADSETALRLEFDVPSQSSALSIPVQKFLLTGFLSPNETFDLKHTIPSCKLEHAIRICEINVPAEVNLLELPELYYPELLKVTLNGQNVPYHGLLYQGQLITSIVPEPGKLNKVTIEFTGLTWANKLSWLGWGLWLFLLIQNFMPQILRNGSRRIEK